MPIEDGLALGNVHPRPSTRVHLKKRIRPRNGQVIDFAYEQEKERHRISQLSQRKGLSGAVSRSLQEVKPWIVTITTGICVGIVATYLQVLTAWLQDIRTGVCTPQPYLSHACGLGSWRPAGEPCREWKTWLELLDASTTGWLASFVAYVIYLVSAIAFASLAAFFVQVYAPYAYHTGIPEIKAILGGLVIEDYLGGWTLLIKSVGLSLAVASGLSLGNEGPMVHIAACIGNLTSSLFRVFRDNEGRKRDVLSAAAASGLSVAFGAPLGGVLFSLEEASSFFPGSVLWHSFVCAIVAAVTLQYFDPLGTGRLVLFEVNASTEWRGFELLPWLFLGACGGLFGHYFTQANAEYARFRATSDLRSFPILEVTGLSCITALASYLIPFTRTSTSNLVSSLFTDCSGPGTDGLGLCERDSSLMLISLLLVTALAKTVFTIATFGARIPAGIFLPSTAIGACFGRAVGIIMQEWQRAYPSFWIFGSCPPDTPCIAPSLYAVVGAASALGGVTRMTLSLVVVVFELTGAVSLVVQIMSAVMVSKFVGDFMDRDGVYEMWIALRSYTFINPKVEFRRDDLLASACMTTIDEMVVLYDKGMTIGAIENLLGAHAFNGFAIVRSEAEATLLGFVARPELEYAIKLGWKQERYNDMTRVRFSYGPAEEDVLSVADYVEHAPLTVTSEMPMEVVVQLFQRLGLRYMLFTTRGLLTGLLTKNDIQHLIRTDGSRSGRADIATGARRNRQRAGSGINIAPEPQQERKGVGTSGYAVVATNDEVDV